MEPLRIVRKKAARVFNSSARWKEIGGKRIYFRSSWEWRYAGYLQFMKEQHKITDWLYEPETFWFETIKRGVRSYKPDFKVIELTGEHYWVEVKGFMDKKSITKLKRFNRFYPKEKMVVVDSPWFVQNHCILDMLMKGKK
jgi:hypothetical protein